MSRKRGIGAARRLVEASASGDLEKIEAATDATRLETLAVGLETTMQSVAPGTEVEPVVPGMIAFRKPDGMSDKEFRRLLVALLKAAAEKQKSLS